MATVAECLAAIQAAMAGIPHGALAALPDRPGYAFQAYVFMVLGSAVEARGWQWHHPGGIPTFASTNGAS